MLSPSGVQVSTRKVKWVRSVLISVLFYSILLRLRVSRPTYSRRPYRSHTCSALFHFCPLSRCCVEGYAYHVSRNRQTEFLGAGPKHLQFSDKLLLRYHRCTWAGRERHFKR